jgi:formate dehydrogenase alpha subunit
MATLAHETVRLTIDGIPIAVPKGTLVIEAARQAGVMIPHFCYHPKLAPDANCRMCLVEIEKMPKLQTACTTQVAEGMVVRTATTVVNDAHRSVLELILANHPLDCPVCDQGGRCDLQDYSHQYTPTTSRFVELKRVFPKEYFSPLIETQMNRCVQCLRCVRYCDQVIGVHALAPVGRGTMTEIKHFGAHQLDCEFCGGCVQICPVGAITSRLSMYEFRPWMLKRAETVCGYCGDGCQLTLQTKNNDLIEVMSAYGAGRNNGDLCARGFFGYHASTHPDRLRQPLIRQNGRLVETSWEEALEYVAQRALSLKTNYGGQAFAGLITARCTNEDLYVFQKFMRLVIGTNKLDSSVRYGYINAIHALRRVLGTHRWTVTFDDLVNARALLLVGTNVTETNPITGLKVKEAVTRRGATLVTVEALNPAIDTISNIANLSTHHFGVHPGQFATVVLGLLKAVVEEGLIASSLAQRAPAFVQAVSEAVRALSWTALEQLSGASPVSLKDAARAFALAARSIIVLGQGVLRQPGGAQLATTLLDLLLLTGHHERPGSGIAPLAEENNEQGAIEMGATAEYWPGPAELGDARARERLIQFWKEDLPSTPARTLLEILDEARAGTIKAMVIVGENPVGSLPPSARAREALENLDLLVCQELFLTETARLAHVVLPACSYAEKDGTFTNTEGHVQAVRRAIEPLGESRPDWEIVSALAARMGAPLEYGEAWEITEEIRSLLAGYGLLGPAPLPSRPDEAVVTQYLQEGYREDLGVRYRLPQHADRDVAGTFTLLSQQSLFHSGKYSTRAKGLLRIQATGSLTLNPADAARLGLTEGSLVRLSNGRGALTAAVKVRARVPEGLAVFPEHFDQELRHLFDVTMDPRTGVPYCKTARVHLEAL